MKRNNTLVFALAAIMISTLTSCQAIGDIFKAGFWSAIIVVILVVAIIIWIISKARK